MYLDGDHALQLLLGKEILPVLILAFKLVISAINSGFLLLKRANLFLKNFNFLSLLNAASNGTLTVLESLSGFLVCLRVLFVVVSTTSVDYCLFDVLLLFLGEALLACSISIAFTVFFLGSERVLRLLLFVICLGEGVGRL